QGMPDCPLLVPADDTLVHGRESSQFYVGGSSAGGRTPRPRSRAAALRGLLFSRSQSRCTTPYSGIPRKSPRRLGKSHLLRLFQILFRHPRPRRGLSPDVRLSSSHPCYRGRRFAARFPLAAGTSLDRVRDHSGKRFYAPYEVPTVWVEDFVFVSISRSLFSLLDPPHLILCTSNLLNINFFPVGVASSLSARVSAEQAPLKYLGQTSSKRAKSAIYPSGGYAIVQLPFNMFTLPR
ncbi:hypothetical protein B0H14DRAFT_2640170, partial [Mycena olivaceomarginata]